MLIAALTNEPKSEQVQSWFESQTNAVFVVSDWVITEFSSALSVKLRMRQITPVIRAGALAVLGRYIEDSFDVLSLPSSLFRKAASFAEQHDLALRGGDALHLAVAANHGATVCTLDRRMHEAGAALGLKTIFL